MESLGSVAVLGVAPLISDFVGFDPAWFHLRLCSKEMHAIFDGRIKVDHKQMEDVIDRRLCNLKFLEPCEGFRCESTLFRCLYSVRDPQTVIRFLNSDREQAEELCEEPTWIHLAVRAAILASDLEFLKWLNTFAIISDLPLVVGNLRISDDPEIFETLIDLRHEPLELEEWECMIELCVGSNLTNCLDYITERGPIKSLWHFKCIYFAICDRKDLGMLKECFRIHASLDEVDFFYAFEKSLDVGWTEGALWLISRVKHSVLTSSLMCWVRHQEQEPDIAIFARFVTKVYRPLDEIMDMMISKGFWKHVELLKRMGVGYAPMLPTSAQMFPSVCEQAGMTNRFITAMFERIFSDILFVRPGMCLGNVISVLEVILRKHPHLSLKAIDEVWLPMGIARCFTPMEVIERDGTRPKTKTRDVWTRTAANKQEEVARDRIIHLLTESGADVEMLLVEDKRELFRSRKERYRKFLRHSRFTFKQLGKDDPGDSESISDYNIVW